MSHRLVVISTRTEVPVDTLCELEPETHPTTRYTGLLICEVSYVWKSGWNMLEIDGSFGEGGGQIVRSSLALSLVTGKPFTINNVRAKRSKPGLLRQHLTAVKAAAKVGNANVSGAVMGAREFTFKPGKVRGGGYDFRIGTAGSTTLVLQTVLPALLTADSPSELTLEGGTHNPFAPPFDFLSLAYLPLINRMGPRVTAILERPGFFPAGGGRVTVKIEPSKSLGRLELMQRGEIVERRVRAIVANLPRHIGDRECETVQKKTGWQSAEFRVDVLGDGPGPGNVLLVELQSENITEVFTGFGKQGRSAEQVANDVVNDVRRYTTSDVPVGEYLADQLLLPLGIGAYLGDGGGTFRTLGLTRHSTTHIDVLKKFMKVKVDVDCQDRNDCTVRVG